LLNTVNLSRVRIRLNNINKNVTKYLSFDSSPIAVDVEDAHDIAHVVRIEDSLSYRLNPRDISLIKDWNIYAYDESVQCYNALEGSLIFCSCAVIKMEENAYKFNLSVLPYFLTSIEKYKTAQCEGVYFAENIRRERNKILIESKIKAILESVEPHSIVFIDGPLIGGMASAYMVRMDDKLRRNDCIPLYFVKNSDSRLVISNCELSKEFNSDFHWASCKLKTGCRSSFFRYIDKQNSMFSKVFTYIKALAGFTQRMEMHVQTYEKYKALMPSLLNLVSYFYIVQGDYTNPQVRPIAIAEKYAREGLKILNIPVLLSMLGFHPTINQVRFG